eukprot:753132-Hanusia_phi.AAC.2
MLDSASTKSVQHASSTLSALAVSSSLQLCESYTAEASGGVESTRNGFEDIVVGRGGPAPL